MNVLRIIAITRLLFNGLPAVAGELALVGDPSGRNMGWTTKMPVSSPFKNFLIPGIIFCAGNGVLSISIAILSTRRIGTYPLYTLFQGIFLGLWIIIQMIMLDFYHVLHLLYRIISASLTGCGYLLLNISPAAAKS